MFLLSITLLFFLSLSETHGEVRYQTSFGHCPSHSVGLLTLKLFKKFTKNHSLLDVKNEIIKNDLDKKYFLSSYSIKYNLINKSLKFNYNCPRPMARVQIYSKNGEESSRAILVDNGHLYDPTYEVLLRQEDMIKYHLLEMALPKTEVDQSIQFNLAAIINDIDYAFREMISEVIINEEKELIIILSIDGAPSSAFLGIGHWEKKIKKLKKILDYMVSKNKVFPIINLTNLKKVVVKFSDNF